MDNLKQYHTLLNRLLLAQMYRTEAYRKASESATDPELRRFFAENAKTGEMFIEEISLNINPLYITETEDTDIPTQYQRVWTMLPDVLFGAGKNVILDKCLMGENLTIRMYTDALANHGPISAPVRNMLLRQRVMLSRIVEKASHLKVSRFQILFRRFVQIKRLFLQKRILFQ